MWFRNPFRHITVYADLTVSSDVFFGDPDNLGNFPNTGLLYMKSTKKNAEALEYWYEARERFPSINEQNVFNKIKREFVYKFQLKIQYISTDFCGGFCNRGKDMNKICTMHANCCVGLRNKIHDLRNILADWKNFTSLPDEIKKTGQFTWRVPGRCIH